MAIISRCSSSPRTGVIATDPVSLRPADRRAAYVDEIKKVTDKPIKYLIYSHHHFDHIAGGKAFKEAGAKVVAHKHATARLKVLKDPHTLIPDESVGDKKMIKLGGTTLELRYTGRNHSDSTLVMRLPKEKIVFVVDFDLARRDALPARGFIDIYPGETGKPHQEDDRDGLGAHDPRSSGAERPARHAAPTCEQQLAV